VRGDSTDPGSPLGPFQAPIVPFSWNTPDGERPYPAPLMDDPSALAAIVTSLTAGAGAGVIDWDKANWLKTAYEGLPGDFDFDQDVDGDDFLAWQRNHSVGNLSNWQENFGTSNDVPAVTEAPEPSSLILIAIGHLLCARAVRASHRKSNRRS
jgi:hypothetical protein